MEHHGKKTLAFISALLLLGFLFFFKDTTLVVTPKGAKLQDRVDPKASLPVRSCVWSPRTVGSKTHNKTNTDCLQVLYDDILASVDFARGNRTVIAPHRWLFFGDSTVGRLFKYTALQNFLLTSQSEAAIHNSCSYKCKDHLQKQSCDLNNFYGFQGPPDPPLLPLYGKEGPVKLGLTKPGCQDCQGCNTQYTLCQKNDSQLQQRCGKAEQQQRGPFLYGGYFSIEFARDVEVQTPTYRTTQENVVAHIQKHFATASLLQDFGGLPVCVVSGGLHDMAIPNITLNTYLTNVEWYLSMLRTQCSHIIWLQNTAPLRKDDNDRSIAHVQTAERTKQWNEGVYHHMQQAMHGNIDDDSDYRPPFLTFLDVYNASLSWPHDKGGSDNVHMDLNWYKILGNFFVRLARDITQATLYNGTRLHR